MQRNAEQFSAIPQFISISGQHFPVVLNPSSRARRLRLRVHSLKGEVVYTYPNYTRQQRLQAFWEERQDWLVDVLSEMPKTLPLTFGKTIPVLGRELTIVRADKTEGRRDVLPVLSTTANCEEVVTRILQTKLRTYVEKRAADYAERIDKKVKSIVLRDPSSCWGTCMKNGRLMFSWRLVFAPRHVLDYLIAHEVAHLRHMNHGPRFWELCYDLCPRADQARQWLKEEGATLYRYGR